MSTIRPSYLAGAAPGPMSASIASASAPPRWPHRDDNHGDSDTSTPGPEPLRGDDAVGAAHPRAMPGSSAVRGRAAPEPDHARPADDWDRALGDVRAQPDQRHSIRIQLHEIRRRGEGALSV